MFKKPTSGLDAPKGRRHTLRNQGAEPQRDPRDTVRGGGGAVRASLHAGGVPGQEGRRPHLPRDEGVREEEELEAAAGKFKDGLEVEVRHILESDSRKMKGAWTIRSHSDHECFF